MGAGAVKRKPGRTKVKPLQGRHEAECKLCSHPERERIESQAQAGETFP